MNTKTRSSRRTLTVLLVIATLLTIVPVGLTRRSAEEPIQKTTKPGKKDPKESDLTPWTLEKIGHASDGAARKRQPDIQIQGASDGYGQTRDSLNFLSRQSEGNFDLSVRLDAIEASGLGGLMVRVPGSYGNELYFRVTAHRSYGGNAQVRAAYRSQEKKDAYESVDKSAVVALPVYLRLRRVGAIFSAESSSDGLNYRELLKFDGKGTRLAARQLNVGLVQSSESSKVAASALFKGVLLQSTEPRVAELVSVGVKEPLVGGVATSGAIVRSSPSGPPSAAEDVAYLKSDSAYLKVPRSVTFSPGKPSATFEVQSLSVNKPTPANLTVVLNGQKKTVKVKILPQDAVGSVSIRPGRFFTPQPRAIVTVNLVQPAPSGGTRVFVSSSSPKVRVPRVVIVPAGEQSIQFDASGSGLGAGNTFVTVTSGRVSIDAVADINGINQVSTGLECPLPALTPDVATDGQRVYLSDSVQEGARVFLAGDRYNNAPPTRAFPEGEGRERVFCGCQHVLLETFADFDGGEHTRPYFLVPMNAPSGDYTAQVRSKEGDCSPGGIGSDVCPADICTGHNLFVAPSYMVSRLNRMDIKANAEDSDSDPAEMSFTFASFSGKPITEGANAAALVNFSGIFPGGSEGSGHLTNVDDTQVFPQVPLFIGSESQMTNIECVEECSAFPAGRQAECLSICRDRVSQNRFSDHFEFTFGGVEFDSSPSKWWGIAGGVGAAALGCFFASCAAGAGLGLATEKLIKEAVKEEDDKLGTGSRKYTHFPGGFEWGTNLEQEPLTLAGDREKGDIDLYLQNFRVGGPQILQYSVKLKSISVVQGYEDGDCDEPNEVFLNSRAFLYQGGALTDTKRFPSNTGVWKLNTGATENFGGVPLVLEQRTFPAEAAPESPLLYIELGVWEDDDEKDLMGIASETIFLPELLSRGLSNVVDDISPEGLFIRRAKIERFVPVHGYAGSDRHCFGFLEASAGDPNNHEEGRVNLIYEIEITWLKRTRR